MILARNHRSPLLPPNLKIGFLRAQLSSWEDSLDCLDRASLHYRHSRLRCHTADLNCTRLAGLKPCVYLRNLLHLQISNLSISYHPVSTPNLDNVSKLISIVQSNARCVKFNSFSVRFFISSSGKSRCHARAVLQPAVLEVASVITFN